MSFSQLLLPEFDAEMKNTRKMLDAVPDGIFEYQPHAKSMTVARLATHVAEIPGWAGMMLSQETLEIPADYKPYLASNRKELLGIFDKNAAEGRHAIDTASDADWGKTWTLIWGGKPMISEARNTLVRTSVMNHLIHHRAQLSVYLRLNDVAVPGMYGPSADEANTWGTNA